METSHLVFLPGLDGTGLSFAPMVALLPPDVRATVVVYPYEKLSFAETVEHAARQFPADTPVIVIAESFSGPVAVELVASGRVNATGLVLAATFAKSPRPILSLLSRFLPLEILLQAKPPQAVEDYILGKEYVARLKPMWEKIREKVPAAILAHRLRLIGDLDVTSRLAQVSIPCCYIQATEDAAVPATALDDFVEAVPGIVVKKMKGPHFILQAQPEASLAAIQDFIIHSTGEAARFRL